MELQEQILWKTQPLAYIFRKEINPEKTTFLTPSELNLMSAISELLRQNLAVPRKVLGRARNVVNRMVYSSPPEFAMRVATDLTDEEKLALYWQVLKLPRNSVALEVGSYLGASACVIGSAIARRNGLLHCVGTWQNQAMDTPEWDTWPEFQANTEPLGAVVVPHRGFSTDVARHLSVALDFLFIDGDHSEEAVDADLSAWLPKVKPGGIVAMHDVGWAEGVRKGIEKHLRGRITSEKRLPQRGGWQNLMICKFLG